MTRKTKTKKKKFSTRSAKVFVVGVVVVVAVAVWECIVVFSCLNHQSSLETKERVNDGGKKIHNKK